MFAAFVTRQLVFDGVVTGMVYGLVAVGIVLVYRATRVINFAVGNLGLVGGGLVALLSIEYGVPYWIAVVAGLTAGTLYGALIELTVIRRLFNAPRVIVLVATIGVAQLSEAIVGAYPGLKDAAGTPFPQAIRSTHEIGGIRVGGPQLAIVVVVPLVTILLAWFLTRTTFGKSVKASAENRDLARLAGISPKRVSTFVWAVAGALSTVSLALMASQSGTAAELATLGPGTMVRGLIAAVIAGMVSFPLAFAAGIVIGVTNALVSFNFLGETGLTDFILFVVVLVAVFLQTRRPSGETQSFAFVPKRRPVPERLRSLWWVRQLDRIGLAMLALVAVVVPLVMTQPSRQLLYTIVLVFALCGLSLTVLTGWAGQLSLGQWAFAGIGALLTAALQRGITVDIGWRSTRLLHGGLRPLTFESSLVLAVLISAALAALIGVGALRVRGLLLAVSTFALALAADQYVYRRPILRGTFPRSVPFPRMDFVGVDLRDQRSYYYFVLVALLLVTIVVGRLRRTGIGRTTIAVRDNPDGAAAYTVSATRVKLRVFALAGGIAALAGALLGGALQSIPLTGEFFGVDDSLRLVAIVVIGGLGSVSGPILGALWVIGIPAFFPHNDLVPLLTSSIGLLLLLLYFPGGLVQLAFMVRDAVLDIAERRLGPPPAKQQQDVPSLRSRDLEPIAAGIPWLQTSDVNVRFGGNRAVIDVSIEVGAREVVGLIGTNGAGKTTLMNAISGFVRSTGRIEALARDVSALTPAQRARRGLGRTFQAATLFPELTVRESVQLALEARHRSGILSSALYLPTSIRVERVRQKEADELVDFLGLGRYGDTYIAELSTGTRRIVELAGLLALDARVLLLDEPTAGLAQRETEAFGPLIGEIRRELDASVLVIEHDMPLIMSISDRVYCLDLGRIIAEGLPDQVRNDPAVIDSYLGTDDRAIARSGDRGDAG